MTTPEAARMDSLATRSVSEFEKIDKLGEGTYGTVFLARDKRNGQIVALKKVRMTMEKNGFPLTSIREIKILKQLHHPNIIQLLDVAVGTHADSVFLVFEYLDNDIAGLLGTMKRGFEESEIKTLMYQLLDAVSHIHERYVIHRDIKLSNLLLSRKGRLKLADFGLARAFSHPQEPMTPKVVTLWYRAPELLLGDDKYHDAVDMWAVGCVFGELLLRKPLLPGKNEMDELNRIFELLGVPSEKIWPGLSKIPLASKFIPDIVPESMKYNRLSLVFPELSQNGLDLINKLLLYDPTQRLTAAKALRHPYFKELPLPKPLEQMPTYPTHAAVTPGRQTGRLTAASIRAQSVFSR